MPNGVPLTSTVRRLSATVRTVLTGIAPNRRRVVFWLTSARTPPACAASPCSGAAERNGMEAMEKPSSLSK